MLPFCSIAVTPRTLRQRLDDSSAPYGFVAWTAHMVSRKKHFFACPVLLFMLFAPVVRAREAFREGCSARTAGRSPAFILA
jgi:hypothetical protein